MNDDPRTARKKVCFAIPSLEGGGAERVAVQVLNALDGELSESDRAFYNGKVAAANFFAKNVLPRLSAERKTIEGVDLTIMDLREEAF